MVCRLALRLSSLSQSLERQPTEGVRPRLDLRGDDAAICEEMVLEAARILPRWPPSDARPPLSREPAAGSARRPCERSPLPASTPWPQRDASSAVRRSRVKSAAEPYPWT